MKKGFRTFLSLMTAAVLAISPAQAAFASNNYDAAVDMVTGTALFPGDHVSGLGYIVDEDGNDITGDGSYSNTSEGSVYQLGDYMSEDGSLSGYQVQLAGWLVKVTGGTVSGNNAHYTPNDPAEIEAEAQRDPSEPKTDMTYAWDTETVTLTADMPTDGRVFDHWELVKGNGTIEDPSASATTYTMGTELNEIKAVFAEAPQETQPMTEAAPVPEPTPETDAYADPGVTDDGTVTIDPGTTDGQIEFTDPGYQDGSTVYVDPNPQENKDNYVDPGSDSWDDQSFDDGSGWDDQNFDDGAITIETSDSATWEPEGDGSDTITIPTEDTVQEPVRYTVTVVDGTVNDTETAQFEQGELVTVKADQLEGLTFTSWTADVEGVFFDNVNAEETVFPMPATDVKVTAQFEAAAETQAQTETQPQTEVQVETQAEETQPQTEIQIETQAEETQPQTEIQIETQAEETQPQTEIQIETQAEETQPQTESQAQDTGDETGVQIITIEPETPAATEAQEVTEVQTETSAATETEAQTEVKTEAQTEAKTEAQTETKAEEEKKEESGGWGFFRIFGGDTDEGTETEAKTEAQTEAKTEEQTEAKTEEQTETQTEAKTEEQTEAQTEEQTEDQTETEIVTEDESELDKTNDDIFKPRREQEVTEADTESDTESDTKAEAETETETETESEPETEDPRPKYRIQLDDSRILMQGQEKDKDGYYAYEGDIILMSAPDYTSKGYIFTDWTIINKKTKKSCVYIADSQDPSLAAFEMPAANVYVQANYAKKPADPEKYNVWVANGSGDGQYEAGDIVTIVADPAPSNMRFVYWNVTTGNASLANRQASTTTFVMPAESVRIDAIYTWNQYTLTVQNGSGSGTYSPGTSVQIAANWPSDGYEFAGWQVLSPVGTLSTYSRFYSSLVMPAGDVTVKATYKAGPNPANNYIDGISNGDEYLINEKISFSAYGAGMNNTYPNPGDYRYEPVSYQIGSVSGTFKTPYHVSMAISTAGNYTLTVTFAKEVYDGNTWKSSGTTDKKSVNFSVVSTRSVKTGDNTPLALLGGIAGGALLLIVALVVVLIKRNRS